MNAVSAMIGNEPLCTGIVIVCINVFGFLAVQYGAVWLSGRDESVSVVI